MPASPPFKLFIIYAREDQPALSDLKSHLRLLEKRGDLAVWYDGEILPGQDWNDVIQTQLATADIILLLISKHFFNSEYIERDELKKALDRHTKGETIVVPVILKPCLWDAHSEISALQVLPKDGKPVSSWSDSDEAWEDVARGVQRLLSKVNTYSIHHLPPTSDENLFFITQKVEEGRKAYLEKNYDYAFYLLSTYCPTEYDINPDAYVKLGYLYHHGLGIEQNFNESLRWYRKAAAKGNAWGKNNVGWMYENGCGVAPDIIEAAKWYREAADQGLHVAKENLAKLGLQY